MPGVSGTFDLDNRTSPVLRTMREDAVLTKATFRSLGETLDTVGSNHTGLDSYKHALGDVRSDTITTTASIKASWDDSTATVVKSVGVQKAALDDLQLKLREVGDTRATANVDVRGIDDSLAKLTLLSAKLDEVNRKRASARVSVSGAPGALSQADMALLGGGGGWGGRSAMFASLPGGASSAAVNAGAVTLPASISAVGLASAAALPAVVALAGATGTLAASLVGAAAGAGAIGIAGGGALAVGIGSILAVAEPAASSIKAVWQAQTQLNTAVSQAAQPGYQQTQQLRQVVEAENQVTQAQQQSLQAQLALTQARIDARNALTDLGLSAQSAALAERQAALTLASAQQSLYATETSPSSTPLQVQQAELAVSQARLGVRQSKQSDVETNQRLRTARRQGVSGNPQVISATNAASQARLGVRNAHWSVQDAQHNASGGSSVSSARTAYEAALAKAPPGTKELIAAGREFIKEWKTATREATGNLMSVARTVVRVGTNLIPTVSHASTLDTGALKTQVGAFGKWLEKPQTKQFITTGSLEFAENLHSAEKSVTHVFDTLGHIEEAARPFLREAMGAIDHWTGQWDRSTSNVHKTRQDIGHMVDDLKAWVGVVRSGVRLLKDIFEEGSASSQGNSLLGSITGQLDKWDRWVKQNPAKVKTFFRDAVSDTKSLARAAGSIVGAIATVSTLLRPMLLDLASFVSLLGKSGLLGSPLGIGGTIAAYQGARQGFSGVGGGGTVVAGGRGHGGGGGGGGLATDVGNAALISQGLMRGNGTWTAAGKRALFAERYGPGGTMPSPTIKGRPSVRGPGAEIPRGGVLPAVDADEYSALIASRLGVTRAQASRLLEGPGRLVQSAERMPGALTGPRHGILSGGTITRAELGLSEGAAGVASRISATLKGAGEAAAPIILITGGLQALAGRNPTSSSSLAGSVAKGALYGGAAGSFVPVVGTAAGAAGGATLAGLAHIFRSTAVAGATPAGFAPGIRQVQSDAASGNLAGAAALVAHLRNAAGSETSGSTRTTLIGALSQANQQIQQGMTQQGANAASAWGNAFTSASTRVGPEKALEEVKGGMLAQLKALGPAGKASFLASMTTWANQIEQQRPTLRKPVTDLLNGLAGDMDTLGQYVTLSNNQILTGTQQQWQQIAAAMAGPANTALTKVTGTFAAIRTQAIAELVQMGYSRSGAQQLLRKIQSGTVTPSQVHPVTTPSVSAPTSISKWSPTADVGPLGRAHGGRISGQGAYDTVRMADGGMGAPGELVINRHTEAQADRDLAAAGKPPLGWRVATQTVPHSSPMRRATGGYTFIPEPGTNFTVGNEPKIASDLRTLASIMHENIYGISGYRSPAHSLAVGGFADDPHTRGDAADIGVGAPTLASTAQLTAAILARAGLDRPFYPASAAEMNHVQLLGSGISGAGPATGQPSSRLGGLPMGAPGALSLRVPSTGIGGVGGALATAASTAYASGLLGRLQGAGFSVSGMGSRFTGGGSPSANQQLGRRMMLARGWGAGQWPSLDSLWTQESAWQTHATNPTSGAYGIAQALPASKYSTAGSDWRNNPATQIDWGLDYIGGRYGSPAAAEAHERAFHWYGLGGRMGAGVPYIGGFARGGSFRTKPGRPVGFVAGEGSSQEDVHVIPRHGTPGTNLAPQIKVEISFGDITIGSAHDLPKLRKVIDEASDEAARKLLAAFRRRGDREAAGTVAP